MLRLAVLVGGELVAQREPQTNRAIQLQLGQLLLRDPLVAPAEEQITWAALNDRAAAQGRPTTLAFANLFRPSSFLLGHYYFASPCRACFQVCVCVYVCE